MGAKTATAEITDVFGEPEENPNFDPDKPFDTGFMVVGHGIASILDSDGKETGYFVNKCYNQLLDSEGRLIGIFNGTPLFLLDPEGNITNYFLSGSVYPAVMYAPDKYLQSKEEQ